MNEHPEWTVFSASCPSRTSLARIADKWTAMIVITLGDGPARFGAVHQRIDGISKKVLVETLRALERDGMVERRQDGPHHVYALTPLGSTLREPLLVLQHWAEEHIETVLDARDRYDERLDESVLVSRDARTP